MIGKSEKELFLPDVAESLEATYQVEDELVVNMVLTGKSEQDISVKFKVANGAKLKVVIFDFARHSCQVNLATVAGENTAVDFYIAVCAKKNDDKTYNVVVDNTLPGSRSFVKMYGTAEDESRLIFDGTTRIRRGAKKCNVRQEGRIINFGENVNSAVSPRLLIDENDVIASHGAVLGQIPAATLFYLRSRGLTVSEAQKLLSQGYFVPLRKEIASDVVGETVDRLLESL